MGVSKKVISVTKGIFQKQEVYKQKLLTLFLGDVIFCHNGDCTAWTLDAGQSNANPRKRWFVDVYIGTEEENARVNLCPKCVKHFFSLEEKDYVELERSEKLASGKISPQQFKAQVMGSK